MNFDCNEMSCERCARTYALDILREQKQRRDRYRGDTCTRPSRAVVARHAAGVLADRGHAGPWLTTTRDANAAW